MESLEPPRCKPPLGRPKKSLVLPSFRGFVKEENVGNSSVYKITSRGLKYVEIFKQMRRILAVPYEKIQ